MPTKTKINKQIQDRKDTRKIVVLSVIAGTLLVLIIGISVATVPLMMAGPGATPGLTPTVAPDEATSSPTSTETAQGSSRVIVRFIRIPSEQFDPLAGSLEIEFNISNSAITEVDIVDVNMTTVRQLFAPAVIDGGDKSITWDGRTDTGSLITAGEYLVRVQVFDSPGSVMDSMTQKVVVGLSSETASPAPTTGDLPTAPVPTVGPTAAPTAQPTAPPTAAPTAPPTQAPTEQPATEPPVTETEPPVVETEPPADQPADQPVDIPDSDVEEPVG